MEIFFYAAIVILPATISYCQELFASVTKSCSEFQAVNMSSQDVYNGQPWVLVASSDTHNMDCHVVTLEMNSYSPEGFYFYLKYRDDSTKYVCTQQHGQANGKFLCISNATIAEPAHLYTVVDYSSCKNGSGYHFVAIVCDGEKVTTIRAFCRCAACADQARVAARNVGVVTDTPIFNWNIHANTCISNPYPC